MICKNCGRTVEEKYVFDCYDCGKQVCEFCFDSCGRCKECWAKKSPAEKKEIEKEFFGKPK